MYHKGNTQYIHVGTASCNYGNVESHCIQTRLELFIHKSSTCIIYVPLVCPGAGKANLYTVHDAFELSIDFGILLEMW